MRSKIKSLLPLAVFAFFGPGAFFIACGIERGASDVQEVSFFAQEQGVSVEPKVLEQLEAQGSAGYLIYFKDKPDLSPAFKMDWLSRGVFVMESLRKAAEKAQGEVKAILDKRGVKYKSFWIDNIIAVESSDTATLAEVLKAKGIKEIRAKKVLYLVGPISRKPSSVTSNGQPEPNIAHVGAPSAWDAGITGEGSVVSSIDTGVRYTHIVVRDKYRGKQDGSLVHDYNWWDPYGEYREPHDDNGHGTHTMGTMVGQDATGTNITGMAPGAKWIACRGCNTDECTDTALLECAQFIAAPWDLNKANPDPDKRPHSVNNSWGDCATEYDPWYQGVVDAWVAAGIYPAFANGNAPNCWYPEPPGCNTVGNPARYGNVTGVGSSTKSSGEYASHSNWGPTDNPDTINPSGYPNLKPQVLAPGVDVRSSTADGDDTFEEWSGTSMSTPHVTALVALIWNAAPCLIGEYAITETIMEQTATPIPYPSQCGGEGPGNVPNMATGWGEINVAEAVALAQSWCGPSGTLEGYVTDAETGDPIARAKVVVGSRSTRTDATGFYRLKYVPVGLQEVKVQHFWYLDATRDNIEIKENETTRLDITMTPRPRVPLSGHVKDGSGHNWPLYAKIIATPVGEGEPVSFWTDPFTGNYSGYLLQDLTFTVKAQAFLSGYGEASREVTAHDTPVVLDFELKASDCYTDGYAPSANILFSTDFEDSPAGFTTFGTTSFEWGVPTSGPGTAHSGQRVFATKLNGDYEDDENGGIVSPSIDARAGVNGLRLTFWHYLESEGTYDKATVEVSRDGGATWSIVWGPSSGAVAKAWQKVEVGLGSEFAVQNLLIRFKFQSDGSVSYSGWYIDDISLYAVEQGFVAYQTDFELDNGGFEVVGTTSWEWGEVRSGPESAHSGQKAFGTNLAGNYGNDEDGYIMSPAIDTSGGGAGVTVSFWHYLRSEGCCDHAYVDVSKDGGNTWVTAWGPVSGEIATTWTYMEVRVGPEFAVPNFKVRFRFKSDYSENYAGWYVDDVRITLENCVLQSAGLVAGYVKDGQTQKGVADAKISLDSGKKTKSLTTPEDDKADDGLFFIVASPGSHTLLASKYGYGVGLKATTVQANVLTRTDIVLSPAQEVTLHGSVKDEGTHAWPLYAKVEALFEETQDRRVAFTNPFTGEYSLSVYGGYDYTITVTPQFKGHDSKSEVVSVGVGGLAKDFRLAKSRDCNAPGYKQDITKVFDSDFERSDGGLIASGSNSSWAWGVPTSGPKSAHSGEKVWATSLSKDYNSDEQSSLRTPVLDTSAGAGGIKVSFWHYLKTEGGYDFASVEASTDGGTTWHTIYGPESGSVAQEWTNVTITLGPEFASTQFALRFAFESDGSVQEDGWYIDDLEIVALSECAEIEGGLLIGFVKDAETSAGISGAKVWIPDVYENISIATPEDQAVEDGLFMLFAPSGSVVQAFATAAGYGIATKNVAVENNSLARLDFELGHAVLSIQPTSLQVNLPRSRDVTVDATVSNTGAKAQFRLKSNSAWVVADEAWTMIDKDASATLKLVLKGGLAPLPSGDAQVLVESPNISGEPPVLNIHADVGHIIKVLQSSHGTITPSGDENGEVFVQHQKPIAFQILPDPGFIVSEVFVDGQSVGAVTHYEFQSVEEDHTMSANFIKACQSDDDCVLEVDNCYGVCVSGVCNFDIPKKALVKCDDKDPCTENDVCSGDGVCRGKPKACPDLSPNCKDATTSVQGVNGRCVAGQCQYAQRETVCQFGCNTTTGQCNADPCIYKVCSAPPNDCYASIGQCVQGVCLYAPLEEGAPCDDKDPCTINDMCDGQGNCKGTQVAGCSPDAVPDTAEDVHEETTPSGGGGGGGCQASREGAPNLFFVIFGLILAVALLLRSRQKD
jgi:subtilisin family serine protease/bacillopeptidase F (M6 metalloprotease family)